MHVQAEYQFLNRKTVLLSQALSALVTGTSDSLYGPLTVSIKLPDSLYGALIVFLDL